MPARQLKTAISTFIFALICAISALAQGADDNSPLTPKRDPDQPKSFREMMQKMRIDQEKRDYQEMLDRGEQAVKLSEQLEKSFTGQSALSRSDREVLDDLEKLVKKIRGELGGENNSKDNEDSDGDDDPMPKSAADGFKSLPKLTLRLVDELKKTSRFGVSAIAIQSSNALLKVVRFLRISK